MVFGQKGHSKSQRRDMKLWRKRGVSCYGTEHKGIKQCKCDIKQLEASTNLGVSRLCHSIFLRDGAADLWHCMPYKSVPSIYVFVCTCTYTPDICETHELSTCHVM